jgi:RimJ/RimL family protein N-acetyltransferase
MTTLFDFATFPEITTERLHLRQLTHSSPQVLEFLNQEPTDTREKATGLIDWLNGMFDSKDAVQWAFILRADGRFLGTGGTYGWEQGDRHVDIGYHILPSEWGKGYATEASHAIIRWCFDNLDVHRIQADCTDGNIGSERVMLKCGFKHEGTWRESCWEHGRFVNIKQFGLLRREYEGA